MTKIRRAGLASVFVLFLVFVSLGLLHRAGSVTPVLRAQGQLAQSLASSPDWSDQGDKLRAGKRVQALAVAQGRLAPFANSGDYAYRSLPITIDKDGVYQLTFGPLPTDFDFPRSPTGILFTYPPEETFRAFAHNSRMVQIGAEHFLQADLDVSGFTQVFLGYTVWLS